MTAESGHVTSQVRDLLAFPRPVQTYHSKTYDRIALKNTGFDGKGKTMFITGGATGVGWSITSAFAKAGVARIVIMSRSPEPLAKAKSELEAGFPDLTVTTYAASLTDHARVTAILREVGAIDILVHCATAAHSLTQPPGELGVTEMQTVYDTNVVGAFHLLSTYVNEGAATSGTSGGSGKTFVNISSAAAHLRIPEQVGYGSSKTAFAQMVECFALHETRRPAADGKARTRLFSMHPGAFYTPLASKYVPADAFDWEDIQLPADYCVWLAGPQSDFLHGRFVWPHWDLDELMELKGRMETDPSFLTMTLMQ